MAGSDGHVRTQSPQLFGAAETVTSSDVMIAISYAADNSITVYRNGALYGSYTKGSLQTYSTANATDVLVGKRHLDAGVGSFLDGSVNEVRVYGSELSAGDVSTLFTAGPSATANAARALANPIHRWSFNDGTANDSIGTAHGTLNGGATIGGGQLSLDGVNDFVSTSNIAGAITAKTLVAWVTLGDLAQQSGGALTLQTGGGATFDSITYGERTAGQWMNGSDGFARSNPANNGGAIQTSLSETMMAIVYDLDGTITLYRDGVLYASQTPGGPIEYLAGSSNVLLGLRHTGAGGDPFLAGLINEARIYGMALNASEIQTLFALGPNALAVPEPASLAMWCVLAGVIGVCLRKRYRCK